MSADDLPVVNKENLDREDCAKQENKGNSYSQNGNYGIGHANGVEIKDDGKVAREINENGNNQSQKINAKQVTVNNNISNSSNKETIKITKTKIERIGNKEISEEVSVELPISYFTVDLKDLLQDIAGSLIEIKDVDKGSIRFIIKGSEQGLRSIVESFASGELAPVLKERFNLELEDAKLIDSDSYENYTKNQSRKLLAFTIAGDVSQADIDVLKAALVDTSDDDEEIKNQEKSRLIEEIRNGGAEGKNLSGADLIRAYLRNADLSDADLRDADLSDADLRGADLRDADLIRSYLSRADLIRSYLSRADLRDADLSGANLSGANLSYANLSGANLIRADLSNANLIRANLSDANLSDAYLIRTNLYRANLSGTKINGNTKFDSKWRKVWEIVNQGAKGQDLSGVDLSDANLNNTDLSNARLVQANLIYSQLNNAKLVQANLIGADLRNAELLEADLTDADLSGAKVENARFGYNLGISESLRRDLLDRKATFEDTPDEPSKVYSPTPSRV